MKLVYVGQPYDRLFPPVQNSIGLIVYNTALHLSNSLHITDRRRQTGDAIGTDRSL